MISAKSDVQSCLAIDLNKHYPFIDAIYYKYNRVLDSVSRGGLLYLSGRYRRYNKAGISSYNQSYRWTSDKLANSIWKPSVGVNVEN